MGASPGKTRKKAPLRRGFLLQSCIVLPKLFFGSPVTVEMIQKVQSMNTFWRHVRNEIAGARNQTMILAALATFLAWIVTALLRAIFG